MATELATRPPAFIDGKTLAANDMRLNILSGGGGATPLQSRSGVRPSGGSPGLVAALATPVMKVRVNAGIADVASTSVTGGFYRVSWDQVDLDIDVSSAQARTDLIIVEVVDTGTSAATGKVRVLKGASGGGRPSNLVVNAHWFTLAATAVRVNAEGTGNIRAQDVTPEIPWAVAPGAPVPVNTLAERNALTTYPGLHVERLDLAGVIERWVTGTTWARYDALQIPVRSRRIAATASGTLASAASVPIAAAATLPTAPHGSGVPYRITVKAQIRVDIPANLGAHMSITVGSTTYEVDRFASTAGATYTLSGEEDFYIATDTAQTVTVNVTADAGTITVTATGHVIIETAPYTAL